MVLRTPFTIYGRQFTKSDLARYNSSTGAGVWNVGIPRIDQEEYRYFNLIKIYNGTSEGGGETDLDLCFGDHASKQKFRIPSRHLLILEGFRFTQPYIINASAITTNTKIICEVEKIPLSHRGIKRALIPMTEFRPKVIVVSPQRLSPSGGTVFYQEGFEDNVLKYDGGAIVQTAPRVRSGGYIYQITSAGSSPWATTLTNKSIGVSQEILTSIVAFECFIAFEAVTTAANGLASLEIKLEIYDGSNVHKPAIKILFGAASTDAKLQYLDNAGSYQDITGATFNAQVGNHMRFKIVFDPVANKYVRIEHGGSIYDLSAIAYQTSSTAIKGFYQRFVLTGIDATTKKCWVDDISITYNEPKEFTT